MSPLEMLEALVDDPEFRENPDINQLSAATFIKDQAKLLLERAKTLENKARQLINLAAKKESEDWNEIIGEHYRVTRMMTDEKYQFNGENVATKFVKTKKKPNSVVITEYFAKNGKLPKGISVSEPAQESIRVKIK